MDNRTYSYTDAPVMCPGKEISSMVCGIIALVWGVLASLFGLIPLYGIIYFVIWGAVAIGHVIPALILYSMAKKEADYVTSKGKVGRNLAIAAIIVMAIALVLIIVFTVLIVVLGIGTGVLSSMVNY